MVTEFNRLLELARFKKSFIDAMVYFPNAQEPMGQIAKHCEAILRFSFLPTPCLDKGLSCNSVVLVDQAPPVYVDEGTG